MAEFSRYEIYILLNQPKPLWLSHIDLSGMDLRGVLLNGATLIGSNLSGVDLRGATMVDVNLGGANLRGAVLIGAGRQPDSPSRSTSRFGVTRHDSGRPNISLVNDTH